VNREELWTRLGYSAALAHQLLGDASYAVRLFDFSLPIPDDEALATMTEIQRRLVTAGILWPDEDPFAANLNVRDLKERQKAWPA